MSYPCNKCRYDGKFTAVKKSNGLTYAFRCGCRYSKEKNVTTLMQEWHDALQDAFTPNFWSNESTCSKNKNYGFKNENERD